MFPTQKHNRITKIIVLALLANFAIANFAFGQGLELDPGVPTPAAGQEILDPALEGKAQTGIGACKDFSKKVFKFTNEKARAIWDKDYKTTDFNGIATVGGCYIVPVYYKVAADGISGSAIHRPGPYIELQQQIIEGKGITAKYFTETQARTNKEQNAANPLSLVIAWILVPIFAVINTVIAGIAALAGNIFTQFVDPILHVTVVPTVVNTGWMIVRDICNMFFILAFIVMALMSILRIKEEYNFRAVLPKLVIMALLVNFSQVIAVTIMNAVNFLAAAFWTGDGVSFWKIFTTIMRIVNPVGDFGQALQGGAPGELALGLGRLAFVTVAAVVFIALAAMFVIRLVGLYVLIIFSPIAYVAYILPATKKFAEEWWSKFLKYLIWAPIALFMLRLTIFVVDNDTQFNLKGGGPHDSYFVYFILTAFMAAALLVAEQAGMVGSKAIVQGVTKGAKGISKFGLHAADKWLAKGAKMTGGGGYNTFRRASSYFSVGAWKKGWQLRSEEKEKQAYTISGGKRADLFNRVISREDTDFALRGQQAEIAEHEKHITTKNREELATLSKLAIDEKDPYKALAYANRMAANFDLNELLSYNKYTTDAKGLAQYIEEKLVPLMGKQAAYRAGYDLSRTAEEVNHWNYARVFTGKYDEKTGEIEYEVNSEVDRERLIEIGKLERRAQVGRSNRLGWGFQETDVDQVDPTTGKTVAVRRNVGWDNFGRTRWGTEIADNEARNQFNVNALMNVMLHNSKDALKLNKSLWIQQVNAKLIEMTPDQIKQWRNRIATPVQGWDAKVADGQTFTGIETVERYIRDGDLSVDDIKEMGPDGKGILEALQHHRGSGPTPPGPANPPNPPPPANPPNQPPPANPPNPQPNPIPEFNPPNQPRPNP